VQFLLTYSFLYAKIIIAKEINFVKRKENKNNKEVQSMIDTSKMTAEERKVIEARREYQKKWRNNNKDKVKQHNANFYNKLSAKKENAPH
jgi:hypothetical protein